MQRAETLLRPEESSWHLASNIEVHLVRANTHLGLQAPDQDTYAFVFKQGSSDGGGGGSSGSSGAAPDGGLSQASAHVRFSVAPRPRLTLVCAVPDRWWRSRMRRARCWS